MAVKDSMKSVEALFNTKKKTDVITLENIAKEFSKQPTAAQAKKIHKFAKDSKIEIISASEHAKFLSAKEAKRRAEARKKLVEGGEDEFDLHKEKEVLNRQSISLFLIKILLYSLPLYQQLLPQ